MTFWMIFSAVASGVLVGVWTPALLLGLWDAWKKEQKRHEQQEWEDFISEN